MSTKRESLPDCQELTLRYRGRLGVRITVEVDSSVCGLTAIQVVNEIASALEETSPPREEWN